MRSVIFSQWITRSLGVIKLDSGAFDKSTCKRVLDLLEAGDLTLGQDVIKRVAVVEQRQRWRSKESPRSLCKTSNNRLPMCRHQLRAGAARRAAWRGRDQRLRQSSARVLSAS